MRFVPTSAAASELSSYRAVAREYASYFARVYAAAREVSGAAVVVDSSKNASTAYALRTSDAFALGVLHVVRDSRGVAYSWTKEVLRPEADENSVRPHMERYSPWTSALLWDAHNAAFGLLSRRNVPVRRVRYEDFLTDPVGTIRAMADFLGVGAGDVDAIVQHDRLSIRETHQAAGNPIRFRRGELTLRSDDAWRAELAPGPRRVVTTLTFPLMAHYGYYRARRGSA